MYNLYDFLNRTTTDVFKVISLLLDDNIYMTFHEREILTEKLDDLISYLDKLKKES